MYINGNEKLNLTILSIFCGTVSEVVRIMDRIKRDRFYT